MANKEIIKGVRHQRKLYRAGDSDAAEELDSLLTSEQVDSLKERGVIAGDFEGQAEPEEDEEPEPTNDLAPARAQGVKRETENGDVKTERSTEDEDEETELPGGFPARMQLVKAGFDTTEKVNSASDEQLLDVDGIGDTTLKQIREQSE